MQTFLVFISFFVLSVSCSRVKLIRNQTCPERPVLKPSDVDHPRFSGIYYLQYDYNDPKTNIFRDCVIYNLDFKSPEDSYAYGCSLKLPSNEIDCSTVTGKVRHSYDGTYDPESAGRFLLDDKNYYYTLLDLDYKSFAMSYLCKNLPGGQSEEQIRISTTTPTISGETQKIIDAHVDKYFELALLRKIDQSEAKCSRVWSQLKSTITDDSLLTKLL